MLSHAEAGPEAMLEAESAGREQHLDLPEHLGRCAASLWDRFVEAAQINGGVPGVGNQRLTKHEKNILEVKCHILIQDDAVGCRRSFSFKNKEETHQAANFSFGCRNLGIHCSESPGQRLRLCAVQLC